MGGGGLNRGDLGAWVVKYDPGPDDLETLVAAGEPVGSWCVSANYRSALIARGDQVLLWVVGSGKNRGRRGFRGRGWITGEVFAEVGSPEGEFGIAAWTADSRRGRDRVKLRAPMDLRVWDAVVPESTVVADPALAGIEVVRVRQMSNPNWVSATELAALNGILPPAPPRPKR